MRRHVNTHLLPITAACAMGLFTKAATAETYQVGPDRDLATLDEIVGQLLPGDVVELDGDNTYDGGVVLEAPGTADQPIIIRGIRVNGNRPHLDGGYNTVEARANHYIIEGLELTGGESRCFFHHADDITFRDSLVHDCPAQGILGADGDSGSLLLEFVEVHHCGGGDQDHQIYMATDEEANPGSVFRMQHCYVHDANGGNNVKSRAERNEIYCNWVEGARYHELELIGPDDGIGTGGAQENSDVVGNVLLKRNADSFVVRFGGDATGESQGRYRFVNNTVLVRPDGGAVFRLFDGLQSVEMHNNVFFALDGGTVNLVREVEAAWTEGRQIVGSNNWVGQDSTNVPEEWTGTLVGGNPGFADLDNFDLTPTETSPLGNAGTTETVLDWDYPVPNPWPLPDCVPPQRSVGSAAVARQATGAIDIGAYEGEGTAGGPPMGTGGTGEAGETGAGGVGQGGAVTGEGGSGEAGASNGGAVGEGGSAEAGAPNGGAVGEGGSAEAGAPNGGAVSEGGSAEAGAPNGGAVGEGGAAASEGGSPEAGAANGGRPGRGGASPGGASDIDDSAGEAGTVADGGDSSSDDDGCGCRTAPRRRLVSGGWLLLAGLFALARRRRH